MGGGAVLRSIGRVIGAGGTGRAGVGAAAKSPGQKMRIPSSYTMVDDWEFAGDEDGFEAHPHAVLDDHRHVRDRLIFGSAPTQQEVLEATSDLQDAIKQTITPVSSTFGHEKLSTSLLSVHDKVASAEVSGIQETEGESYANSVVGCGPDLDQDKAVQKLVHSNVLDAFHLLQSNPAIQGMVVSLASDNAVWDAFLKNEKVQEFRQSLEKGDSELVETNKDEGNKSSLIEVMENMKLRVIQYMEKIKELCNQLFGYVDKMYLEKDADFVEKALEASLMLCFTVLLIVLVKRA